MRKTSGAKGKRTVEISGKQQTGSSISRVYGIACVQAYGSTGELELHNDHHSDEALENEMVHGRCKQSGKGVVPLGKQRSGQYNRAIYGRTGLHDADGI